MVSRVCSNLCKNPCCEISQTRFHLELLDSDSWLSNANPYTEVMTDTFVPLLLASSDPRLLFVTSGTATLTETEDPTSRLNVSPAKGWPKTPTFNFSAYRSAKTGLNMMMREWTRILKEDGVKVWCISPGMLATGLGGWGAENLAKMGAGAPSLGGEFIRDVVDGARDSDVGKAIRRDMVQQW
jgi:NAD(P)-dependent dehydrogenase (short-subunit alcohol dehydrogenase family)